jgi:hypothetical protein
MLDNVLRINIKNLIHNWNDFFYLTILLVFGSIYFMLNNENYNGIWVFIVFFLIQFAFTSYLSIKYFYLNKNEVYIIRPDSITLTKYSKTEVFSTQDINKIVVCKSANMDSFGMPFSTFERFRLIKVYINNGRVLILTNLLEYDIEEPLKILENVKLERRMGFSFFI